MTTNRAMRWEELQWSNVRPEFTGEVLGYRLVPKGATIQGIALTRIAPGGEFRTHTDSYHHVFCFLHGTGEGWIGQSRYDISPELVVNVVAGTPHGYRNTGEEDIFLITVNYF